MGRRHTSFRQFLSIAAIVIMVSWTAVFPALADDVGANKSDLITNLLPTVVNISVRKVEAATPPATGEAATVSAPKPPADNTPDIKGYVGSGFVIDPSGVIVTNYHVVDGAFQITVTFSDGTRLEGKALSASRLADLALIKVEAGHPLPAAHWGNSDSLQVGDQVFAVGNPFGLGLSVTAGIVSALNRDIQNSPYDDLIQTDAMINHGNSGGPLFDMQGNVVAVDSTIISPTTGAVGLGFAIPSSSARFVVDQLRTYGWVRPGWIGLKVQQITQEMAEAVGRGRTPRVRSSPGCCRMDRRRKAVWRSVTWSCDTATGGQPTSAPYFAPSPIRRSATRRRCWYGAVRRSSPFRSPSSNGPVTNGRLGMRPRRCRCRRSPCRRISALSWRRCPRWTNRVLGWTRT